MPRVRGASRKGASGGALGGATERQGCLEREATSLRYSLLQARYQGRRLLHPRVLQEQLCVFLSSQALLNPGSPPPPLADKSHKAIHTFANVGDYAFPEGSESGPRSFPPHFELTPSQPGMALAASTATPVPSAPSTPFPNSPSASSPP